MCLTWIRNNFCLPSTFNYEKKIYQILRKIIKCSFLKKHYFFRMGHSRAILLLLGSASSFYLPGLGMWYQHKILFWSNFRYRFKYFTSVCKRNHDKAPVSYCREESQDPENQCKSDFEIFVNRLTSSDSAIPFEYNSFDFCKGKFLPGNYDCKIYFCFRWDWKFTNRKFGSGYVRRTN